MAVRRMKPGRWQPRPTGGQEIILQYASSSTYYTATVDECWFGQIRIRLLTKERNTSMAKDPIHANDTRKSSALQRIGVTKIGVCVIKHQVSPLDRLMYQLNCQEMLCRCVLRSCSSSSSHKQKIPLSCKCNERLHEFLFQTDKVMSSSFCFIFGECFIEALSKDPSHIFSHLRACFAMVWAAHSVALVLAQPDWRSIPKSVPDDRTGSLEFE